MIGRSQIADSRGGVQKYVDKKDSTILVEHGVCGTHSDHAEQMRAIASQRNISKPLLHSTLSMPPGENLTDVQWRDASKAYLEKMGFDLNKTQYSVTRHDDTSCQHIHIIANRVQFDGEVVSDSHHKRKTHEATRAAEQAAGVEATPQKNTKRESGKMAGLRQKIDQSLASSGGDSNRFSNELAAKGVKVHYNQASTGHISGVSFEQNGRTWKGSEVGKNYTLGSLKKRGLNVENNKNQMNINKNSVKNIENHVKNNKNHINSLAKRAEKIGKKVSRQIDTHLTDSERRKLAQERGFEM